MNAKYATAADIQRAQTNGCNYSYKINLATQVKFNTTSIYI
jgi:hypothetical protein